MPSRLLYYAKNDKPKLSLLFYAKRLYRQELERHGEPSYLDLWHSNPLYGKIDTNFSVVQASSANLQLLSDGRDKENLFALDFVADAFNAMKLYLRDMELRGALRQGSFFYPLKAYAGWQSLNELYNNHLRRVYTQFRKQELTPSTVRHYNSLRSFEDYLPIFVQFLNNLTSFGSGCLSRSAFISKNTCPRAVSGLTIEIAKEGDSSDDLRKFEHYFEDRQFSIFLDVAEKFGFYVDMNMPWRLIANLESPAWSVNSPLRNIMEEHFPEGYTPQGMFDTYFTKPQNVEFEEFKAFALSFYTSYINSEPTFDIPKLCSRRVDSGIPSSTAGPINTVRRQTIGRRNITMRQMLEKYDNLFWLRLYMQLRMREMGLGVSEHQVHHELREIEQRYLNMGYDPAIMYITERLSYYLQKQLGKFLSLEEKGRNVLTADQAPDIIF